MKKGSVYDFYVAPKCDQVVIVRIAISENSNLSMMAMTRAVSQ
jgi:hypothetical protein